MHDQQKEERRQDILTTVWQLFQTTSYETVTIAGVAEAAGLAKGTIFLYFKTKEALFLALLEQQLGSWFASIDAGLLALEGTGDILKITTLLCEQLASRPGLTRLLAILHTILERNIHLDEAIRFKYLLKEHFEQTGHLLERCLPFLKSGQGAHALLQCDALVIGFWHLSDTAPVVQQAFQQPELHLFEIHFVTELSIAMQALLYGLEKSAQLPSQP
ncbi:TetR/AcrR family transcriptional regulator [Dictyobacter vulcani]|uniref:TetR/AcrR family transcriptional regulator n=1 Tax=Dictyobacter vulcani TaxID=2607529 RepID=UPI0013866329|nr:TetR/AcrR family transcriptional regulator [Dictyobacter vulcani]